MPGDRAPDPEQCAGKAHAHAHAQAHPHAHTPGEVQLASRQLAALQVCSCPHQHRSEAVVMLQSHVRSATAHVNCKVEQCPPDYRLVSLKFSSEVDWSMFDAGTHDCCGHDATKLRCSRCRKRQHERLGPQPAGGLPFTFPLFLESQLQQMCRAAKRDTKVDPYILLDCFINAFLCNLNP